MDGDQENFPFMRLDTAIKSKSFIAPDSSDQRICQENGQMKCVNKNGKVKVSDAY